MLSIVTDEISHDLETAVSIGWKWGVREFELRRVYLERAPYYPEAFHELLPSLRKTYAGIRFVAVSPGLFKLPLGHWAVDHNGGAKLDASFRLAEQVGCRTVVIFGFERPAGPGREAGAPLQAIEMLGAAAAKAARDGFTLAIEIEGGSYADSGTAAAELVEAVGSPAMGVNLQRWDPSATGDSWERGFERVRRHVRHMHYKAADTPELGGGKPGWDFGWAPKLKALAAGGYAGNISVETHAKPRLERSETTLAALRRVLAEVGLTE